MHERTATHSARAMKIMARYGPRCCDSQRCSMVCEQKQSEQPSWLMFFHCTVLKG